jgi:acetylornithine deacetylase
MELFELTKTLVNLESITGHEQACAEFLRDFLAREGFEVELQPVPPDRANVLALCGKPEVVLSTHLDTVPPFMPAREDEEFIYGRGACDAKGILAAQVTTSRRLRREGVEDFGLLLLVGEETFSEGARVANEAPRGSRYIINGEPTDNKLALGTKGVLQLVVRAQGRMAHSAYPHLGESAIEKLLDILQDLRGLPLPSDPLLGGTTMNIGMISGGRAANIIPDQAEANVMMRTVRNSEELRRRLESLLAGRCTYEVVRETPALILETLEGFEAEVFAYTTDLPSLSRWGRPLLLGPGSITEAHTDHECVRKADLTRAVELYCRLVRQLKSSG